MGIFSVFSRNKSFRTTSPATARISDHDRKKALEKKFKRGESVNYLAQASAAKQKGIKAVKAGKYKAAWQYFNKQKAIYLKHAARSQFTDAQVLALDSEVSENLANILRLENEHDDALSHILYCVIAQRHRPKKGHQLKLKAYFNRCEYKSTSYSDAVRFSKSKIPRPDLPTAQSKVAKWRKLG